MRLRFFTVPIHGSEPAEEELNRFLASHRVLTIDRQLTADGPRSTQAPVADAPSKPRRTPAYPSWEMG